MVADIHGGREHSRLKSRWDGSNGCLHSLAIDSRGAVDDLAHTKEIRRVETLLTGEAAIVPIVHHLEKSHIRGHLDHPILPLGARVRRAIDLLGIEVPCAPSRPP
jgi:hypothetical protein